MKNLATLSQDCAANRLLRRTSSQSIRSRRVGFGDTGAVSADREVDRDFANVRPVNIGTPASGLAMSCLIPGRSWDHNPAPLTSPRSIFLLTERLAQIWTSNERDLEELLGLRPRVAQARAYLASPGCNRSLGLAYLDAWRQLAGFTMLGCVPIVALHGNCCPSLIAHSLRSCCHASRANSTQANNMHPFSDQRRQLTPYGSGEPSHGPIRDRGR